MKLTLFLCIILFIAPNPISAVDWQDWISDFGHDTYQYPEWIKEQRSRCQCQHTDTSSTCTDHDQNEIEEEIEEKLTWCTAKQYLLDHMPAFDKNFMPPSVSVDGDSMFDDQIAFALMANNASKFSSQIPLAIRMPYILPYAAYHEARVNWRPLFFAKFFALVENATSTVDAMSKLVAPNVFSDWTKNVWAAHPNVKHQTDYQIQWASSTSPPVINPFGFVAYGYASCSGWATLVSYMARAVGIPARQVGTPCWNSAYGDFNSRGLAKDNPNVTICWHGGLGSKSGKVGGNFLNNHNWVEYWDDVTNKWVFQNVPPGSSKPDDGLCKFNEETGCDYDPQSGCSKITGGPGAASRDHEIFAVTWSDPHNNNDGEFKIDVDGGPVIDVHDLKLSSGESVSPLVWSPRLTSPTGVALKDIGLRVVNRTEFYRCKKPSL